MSHTVYVYWLRPNYWNVEIVEYIKKQDVFRRGSSLKVYASAAVSKKCFNLFPCSSKSFLNFRLPSTRLLINWFPI